MLSAICRPKGSLVHLVECIWTSSQIPLSILTWYQSPRVRVSFDLGSSSSPLLTSFLWPRPAPTGSSRGPSVPPDLSLTASLCRLALPRPPRPRSTSPAHRPLPRATLASDQLRRPLRLPLFDLHEPSGPLFDIPRTPAGFLGLLRLPPRTPAGFLGFPRTPAGSLGIIRALELGFPSWWLDRKSVV